MKALSIKNPWGQLIAAGIKDIENRTWRTKYRGRIYIHVSGKVVKDTNYNDAQMIAALPAMTFDFNSTKYPDVPAYFRTSAIIGEVDIVDCVLRHPSVWAEHVATVMRKIEGEMTPVNVPVWNWVLANPMLYDQPIENVKGALSLWEYKP